MTSKKDLEPALGAKKRLRAQAIDRRKSVQVDSTSVCRSLEPFLSTKLAGLERFVVVYDALDGEVNLNPLWEPHQSDSRPSRSDSLTSIAYAITRTPDVGMALTVHPVSAELERHRWGYRQPVAGSLEVPLNEVGAVLVPALAFDLQGGRIGWGAGYYDRLLSRLNADVLKIGISDGYIVDSVPTDAHDIPMTHIATAAGVISV
jgi:5,10-methenyltetrahydrofolate synthetase